jgi:hypothetical protein
MSFCVFRNFVILFNPEITGSSRQSFAPLEEEKDVREVK